MTSAPGSSRHEPDRQPGAQRRRSSAWLVWPGALLFGATAVAWNSVGMLAVLAAVDPAEAGRASGIVLFGFYSGFVPGLLLFGATVDAVGYGAAWVLVLAVLGAAAVLMLPTRRRHV